MNERQKETKFLKELIRSAEDEPCQRLQERIEQAEKDEKCIRCAVYLVSIFGLLSLSGLGYAAVLVPEFSRFSSHIATKIFCALGLGSLICVFIFFGFWLRYRAATNQVYDECRRVVRGLLEARLAPVPLVLPVAARQNEESPLYQIGTAKAQDEAELLQEAS